MFLINIKAVFCVTNSQGYVLVWGVLMHWNSKNEVLFVGPAKVAWYANIVAFFLHFYEDL